MQLDEILQPCFNKWKLVTKATPVIETPRELIVKIKGGVVQQVIERPKENPISCAFSSAAALRVTQVKDFDLPHDIRPRSPDLDSALSVPACSSTQSEPPVKQ